MYQRVCFLVFQHHNYLESLLTYFGRAVLCLFFHNFIMFTPWSKMFPKIKELSYEDFKKRILQVDCLDIDYNLTHKM